MSPEGACNGITVGVKNFCRFVFHIISFSSVFVSLALLLVTENTLGR
jgi:hypothetical protein